MNCRLKKCMISQPMAGFTNEEIKATKEKAVVVIKSIGAEILNTFFEDQYFEKEDLLKIGVVHIPVKFLAKSIDSMSLCDVVYFCKGWENARGCKLEHDIALAYGLEIMYEI